MLAVKYHHVPLRSLVDYNITSMVLRLRVRFSAINESEINNIRYGSEESHFVLMPETENYTYCGYSPADNLVYYNWKGVVYSVPINKIHIKHPIVKDKASFGLGHLVGEENCRRQYERAA